MLNVWVGPRDDPQAARPVTHDTGRGVRIYFWAYTSRHILYLQDKNGDENWRLYRVDVITGETIDLTPLEGVQVNIVAVSHKFPHEVILGLNARDPKWHDVFRINIVTGERSLLLRNDQFAEVVVDDDYRPRLATSTRPDGGLDVSIASEDGQLRHWDVIPAEDALTTRFVGFDKSGRTVFLRDSRGRNTAAVFALNLTTGDKALLAEDPRADAQDIVTHPTENHVQAVSFVYQRKDWRVLDQSIASDFEYLQKLADGEVEIASRTLDDSYWIVVHSVDDGPARFHLYDRRQRRARFLFTNRKAIEGLPLAHMRSAVIKSRDGLSLVAYYTLPPWSDGDSDGIPDEPMPMVFCPHGGPWWRDSWGFHPWHQWLANRGYAVLSVNFRSSTGFGKDFINAGNLQWGGAVQADQIDAVRWAIAAGIADGRRVAIFGGSFGGYSTLAGLTFTPEVFACGIDLVGPSNLITFIESIPPYWKPLIDLFTTRIGDHRTPEGRELLTEHSPLTHVGRICRPLLIAQGANDPRVKRPESDQIVQAMRDKGIPVTYLLYPDEGHGFARPENNLSFYAIAEAFLARCIGGRYEPIDDDLQGSSMQVQAGADEVPGLRDALGSLH